MSTDTTVETRDIPLASIRANPDQPRKQFDEESLRGLGQSIHINGLLQPLVVRPDPDPDSGFDYMLIAGERRWRSMNLWNAENPDKVIPEAPCRILAGLDDVRAFELSTLENVGRMDMTIIEEANAYQQMLNAGRTVPELADLFGKTEFHIGWRLGLLTLIPEAIDLVNAGEIGPNLAWHIAQCNPDNQRVILRKVVEGAFKGEFDAAAYAQVMRKTEGEIELFSDNLSPEEREARDRVVRRTTTMLERIQLLSMSIDKLNRLKPEELYAAVRGQTTTLDDALADLTEGLKKARSLTRKAKAYALAVEDAGGSETVTEEASAEKGG